MRHNGKDNNLNAASHGILANRILPTEDPEAYQELAADFFLRFEPRDGVEAACVRTMVDSTWRSERILKQETVLLTLAFERTKAKYPEPYVPGDDAKQAAAFEFCASDTRALDLIIRYESMLRRSYDRAYARLKELQEDLPPKPSEKPKQPTRDPRAELQSRRPEIDIPTIPADQAPPVVRRKPETGDPFHDLEMKKLQNDKCCAINKKPLARGA